MKNQFLTESQARAIFNDSVRDAGGVTKWAEKTKLSSVYVYEIARGAKPITATIAGHLGLELADQMYRRKA